MAVVLLTGVVYAPVGGFDFVNLDDDAYVRDHPRVRQGLSWDNVRWAFADGLIEKGPRTDYWLPLSTISHMAVVDRFGLDPGAHHLVNVVFHLANTVLIFLLLVRITGHPWRSVIVASVFALHPLRVESVVWIAERKDVMSALFGIATLLAWSSYVRTGRRRPYLLATLLFALGLMSKPMVITVPGLMLLMDVWPLGRVSRASWHRLIIEKLPFFVLSLMSAALMTILHPQRDQHGFVDATMAYRVSNALTAYVVYLRRMVWPSDLAVYYPDQPVAAWVAGLCGALLIGITAATIALGARRT
jgi:hypothetical protein